MLPRRKKLLVVITSSMATMYTFLLAFNEIIPVYGQDTVYGRGIYLSIFATLMWGLTILNVVMSEED